MIVDDEPWIVRGIANTFPFTASGFGIGMATSHPPEALDYLLTAKPDVVFADIRMPCVTGLDMLARARAAGLASAFVLISGYAEFPLAQEALRLGAFDYLIKPLDEEVATRLLQRLATHLWAQGGGGASNRSEPSVLPPGVRLPADVNAGFQSLLRHVSLHYREPLSLQSLADAFNLNYTYCCELFRRYTGRTFTAYVTQMRLSRARQLLRDPHCTVECAGAQVGFSDAFYFHKVFKRHCGLTPAQYRRQANAEETGEYGTE